MIITISGNPGSGKTTLAKNIAEKLNLKHYSVGDLRGEMALKRGMTIDELNKIGEKEFFTDDEVDKFQKKLGETEDDFVIDGRLSFHFIPHSLKIFLTVDETVAAKRIMQEKREDEPEYKTIKDSLIALRKRMKSDITRYQKYYKLNPFDEKLYDIVIDSTDRDSSETLKIALDEIKKR